MKGGCFLGGKEILKGKKVVLTKCTYGYGKNYGGIYRVKRYFSPSSMRKSQVIRKIIGCIGERGNFPLKSN